MNQYQVAIVEFPTKHLTGMKTRSTMQNAQQDCSALWQSFGPRMGELLAARSDWPECYGVSVMLSAEAFDYWAAVETLPSTDVPEGMANISLPAGRYAKCTVPNLEKLGEGYMHLYDTWVKSQIEYTCDEQMPSFELYPSNWDPSQPLEIYMPLKNRN